jgi:hypothetical protein
MVQGWRNLKAKRGPGTVDKLPPGMRTSVPTSWSLTDNGSITDEAYRYQLRLRASSGFPLDATVAVPCLWQDCNYESVEPRCGLRW